jgi:hypothetical protein
VKLGISAPGDVKVMRQELFETDGGQVPVNGAHGGVGPGDGKHDPA